VGGPGGRGVLSPLFFSFFRRGCTSLAGAKPGTDRWTFYALSALECGFFRACGTWGAVFQDLPGGEGHRSGLEGPSPPPAFFLLRQGRGVLCVFSPFRAGWPRGRTHRKRGKKRKGGGPATAPQDAESSLATKRKEHLGKKFEIRRRTGVVWGVFVFKEGGAHWSGDEVGGWVGFPHRAPQVPNTVFFFVTPYLNKRSVWWGAPQPRGGEKKGPQTGGRAEGTGVRGVVFGVFWHQTHITHQGATMSSFRENCGRGKKGYPVFLAGGRGGRECKSNNLSTDKKYQGPRGPPSPKTFHLRFFGFVSLPWFGSRISC